MEQALMAFSDRLNKTLGDWETGIWDGEFHTGLVYRQWTDMKRRKSRILLPIMAFIPSDDGKDYEHLGICLYIASDGTHFGQDEVTIYIDGKWYAREQNGKRSIVHLTQPKHMRLWPAHSTTN